MIFLGKVIHQPSNFQVTNLNRKEDQSGFSYSFSLQRGKFTMFFFSLSRSRLHCADLGELHLSILNLRFVLVQFFSPAR